MLSPSIRPASGVAGVLALGGQSFDNPLVRKNPGIGRVTNDL
jgi:hypothetical protein